MRAGLVVPVKAFAAAKVRLAGALSETDRQRLARDMAAQVLGAAAGLSVFVVCDDRDVATWAEDHGAIVEWTPGLGLDGAVAAGVTRAAAEGFDRVVVAHADLPMARDLAAVAHYVLDSPAGDLLVTIDRLVTIVPDRHNDGTNVIALPSDVGFGFAYGPASASRHRSEAHRLGLSVAIVSDPALAWDVDVPDDLVLPDGRDLAAVTRS